MVVGRESTRRGQPVRLTCRRSRIITIARYSSIAIMDRARYNTVPTSACRAWEDVI